MNGFCGCLDPFVVKMLTTEGMARFDASRKESRVWSALAGASCIATVDDAICTFWELPIIPAAQSGFKVATMNQIAKPTVTVCANNSQRRRIGILKVDQKTVNRDELAKYLAQTLDINRFRDFCPNGLQVEGREKIKTLVSGVTASVALIEAAADFEADALLVHHGYFWKGEDARVIGPKHKRLKLLLANDINLFAYHLPLDMHPELGNNAQLAKCLGLAASGRFGDDGLGWHGSVSDHAVTTVGELAHMIGERLGRAPLVVGNLSQPLGKVAWCTGAAQNMLAEAIGIGATTYLSGEISEPTVHLAHEAGVAYLACGHHATERYGVQALGAHISERFGIQHHFVDIANPV
jgi:dinuclear metal center YbgI/SA1388 family protein